MCADKHVCSPKNVYQWTKLFQGDWNNIQDEDRSGRPTMIGTLKIGDSVKPLILADWRVSIDDISKQLQIFVGTSHKIVHDDFFQG